MNVLPLTEIKDVCRKEDGYKDKCLRLPVKGCEGCHYHRIEIIEVKKSNDCDKCTLTPNQIRMRNILNAFKE